MNAYKRDDYRNVRYRLFSQLPACYEREQVSITRRAPGVPVCQDLVRRDYTPTDASRKRVERLFNHYGAGYASRDRLYRTYLHDGGSIVVELSAWEQLTPECNDSYDRRYVRGPAA